MLSPRTKVIIGIVTALAAAAVAATWSLRPPQAGATSLIGFVLLFGMFLLAERAVIPLLWRGERVTVTFTEPIILAGLVVLPAIPLVLAATLARMTGATLQRRPAHKTLFNTAQIALATSLALLVAVFAPVAPLVGAILGMVTFTVVVDCVTVVVVGSVEEVPWRRAIRERFLAVALVEIVFGASVGLAIVGLGRAHPLAPLVLAPPLWIMLRHARIQAKLMRESGLHLRLAQEQRRLIGIQDETLIADAILEACHDIMQVGRARIALDGQPAWERTWDPLPAEAEPDVGVPLGGVDGVPAGRLEVWRRPGKPRFEKDDEGLLLQLGAQTETALANARTLREASAQRIVLARQERLSTLGTLVAGVAHEVNNPLTYLRGNLELALMDLDEMEESERVGEVQRQIGIALQGAGRIAEIVQSLRAVARQRPSSEREAVHLNKAVEDVATVLQSSLPGNLRMRVERARGDPTILTHPTDLHQVLLNLAKNGIEALGGKPGELVMRVRTLPHCYVLEVQDTGPGIPVEAQAKIFTPFFTTKGAHGTGLGLAIVHGIIKDMGGAIRFDTAPGAGTTFVVTLPHELKAPVPASPPPAFQ